MADLNKKEIEFITRSLKEGKPLPDEYRYIIPFETKKEYELTYAEKEREEDILSDTMAVPLQEVKTFGDGGDGWTNKLIFGDNLQILKTLLQMKERGELKNGDGTPGVRLIYIDPPFATRQEFRGRQDQKAYQDKIVGSKFLEFLRKRLVFLRELLAEDGSIYVHLDWKKVHYIKSLMDEIFTENNFIREIIWRIGWVSGFKSVANNWVRNHDTLLYYGKNKDQVIFNKIYTPHPPDYERWGGRPKGKGLAIEDVWGVFPQEGVTSLQVVSFASQYTGFPTQKPEGLLGRIMTASSNPGDLVLDAFAGSGTTGAVAEKLGRRWIIIDCSKLAIYTMQKRMLNLREQVGNRGKPLKAKPFTLYNAGLYDYQMIKDLPWEEYRDFVLKLFQCRDEPHRISGVDLDGYLVADSVMVFNYQKYNNGVLDRGFIDDLHKILGDKVGRRFFIIAPAASVNFLEDYIEKGRTAYFVLRVPYSIINELHKKDFTEIKQPVSEMDVNDTVEAVGFDFIHPPAINCKYYLTKPKKKDLLTGKKRECVIKIEQFASKVISRKTREPRGLEDLSMVMLDYDFDSEVFDLDEVFYAEELKKEDWEIRFDAEKVKGQMMIIYIDIFGNEKREVKTLKDFK